MDTISAVTLDDAIPSNSLNYSKVHSADTCTDLKSLYKNFLNYQINDSGNELKWFISRDFNFSCITWSQMNSIGNDCVEVKIDDKIKLFVFVYKKLLKDDHPLLISGNLDVSSLDDVLEILDLIDSMTLCPGNADPEIVNSNLNSGFVNPSTRALHSCKCELLYFENGKAPRCSPCAVFRNVLRKRITRNKSSLLTSTKVTGNQLLKQKSKESILAYKNQITLLQKQKNRLESKISKQMNKLKSDFSEESLGLMANHMDENERFFYIFLKQQMRLVKKGTTRPQVWDPAVIKWCSKISNKSLSAYEVVREVFHLPAPRTLHNYSPVSVNQFGFKPEVIDDMKKKIDLDDVDDHQRLFSLVIDEVKVKKGILTKSNAVDTMASEKEDMDTSQDSSEVQAENSLIVLMLHGLTTTFKHTLAHFPWNNMSTQDLVSLVRESIQNLESHKFLILVVLCGKSSICQKLSGLLTIPHPVTGVKYKVRSFNSVPQDERDIFFISDPSNIIKTVGSSFFNSGSNNNSCLLQKNQKQILWDHVKETYRKDAEGHLGLCPKLPLKIGSLGPSYNMSIKFAIEVLCNLVGTAVEKVIGDESSETVMFVKYFGRFFNMLNTRNVAAAKRKGNADLNPYKSTSDWRFQFLEEEFLNYLKQWMEDVENSNTPEREKLKMQLSRETVNEIFITVHSVVGSIRYLLDKGAKVVFSEKMNLYTHAGSNIS